MRWSSLEALTHLRFVQLCFDPPGVENTININNRYLIYHFESSDTSCDSVRKPHSPKLLEH